MVVKEKMGKRVMIKEKDTNTYLKELHSGVDKLLSYIHEQDRKIDKLTDLIDMLNKADKAPRAVRRTEAWKQIIEDNKDRRGRITWKNVEDSRQIVFAYLKKAEREGVNIDRTTDLQTIPEYRRVFQHVVYNIGSWKEIIQEYRQQGETKVS
jgi:ribosome biogenesis GTPase A